MLGQCRLEARLAERVRVAEAAAEAAAEKARQSTDRMESVVMQQSQSIAQLAEIMYANAVETAEKKREKDVVDEASKEKKSNSPPELLSNAFRKNPKVDLKLSSENQICELFASGYEHTSHSVFLGHTVCDEGVYRWKVKFEYFHEYCRGHVFHFGATPPDLFKLYDTSRQCTNIGSEPGTCALYFCNPDYRNFFPCGLVGVDVPFHVTAPRTFTVPNGSLVVLEMDTRLHTITFFVEETKVPIGVRNVIGPQRLGITGGGRVSSLSFSRQSSATPAVECQLYPLVKGTD